MNPMHLVILLTAIVHITFVTGGQTFLPLMAGVLGTAVGLGPVFLAAAMLLATGVATRQEWSRGRKKS